MPPILLLHLSDLHFGPHSRFQVEKPERLGKSFHRALEAAQATLGIERKVDLVFVTGDIAEAGPAVRDVRRKVGSAESSRPARDGPRNRDVASYS